uniref:Probable endo-1,4-beta-xylanase C n=1 Tax=Nicotiana tabacum TaxID=4097 RepID=A0A1S3XPB5_TOBAC|nr:PREDICTED: probable endo-1,4-beta-xylanase C [Nicotiana tabacum]XP_016441771.1 PREDICTED: probable endo-1,4-beta-xylanase C [Nicotiana tabacum]
MDGQNLEVQELRQEHQKKAMSSLLLLIEHNHLIGFLKDFMLRKTKCTLFQTRKSKVKLQAVDSRSQPLANATISIKQINSAFSIGNAISPHILTNVGYQEWYNSSFKLTVFENEMKWWFTEPIQGKVDYHLADGMLQYVKNYSMLVRGHNIVWENKDQLPSWAKTLSPPVLSAAVERRFYSLVPRYQGQMMHWDVDNENIHFSYLESQLGENATAYFYKKAHDMDSNAILFLNEYGTIENPDDMVANPVNYLAKIQEIRSMGYNGPLGIGLQGHFDTPNIPYIRSALDILATADLPIWITELDVSSRPLQAEYLNDIMWELHAHPAVSGIIIWSPWQPQGCYKMCLTDNDFKNLPTGDVVDNFMRQLSHEGLIGTTNDNGYFETSLYHGDYEVIIKHPTTRDQSFTHSFNVAKSQKSSTLVKLSA